MLDENSSGNANCLFISVPHAEKNLHRNLIVRICHLWFLKLNQLVGGVLVAGVDVHGQRDARIRVTHQILQTFDIHLCIGIVGAEGVPEHVGGHAGQGLV